MFRLRVEIGQKRNLEESCTLFLVPYQVRLHKRLCFLACALISQMGCPWSE